MSIALSIADPQLLLCSAQWLWSPLQTEVCLFLFVCQGFHWPVRAQKALFATTMQMKSLEMN